MCVSYEGFLGISPSVEKKTNYEDFFNKFEWKEGNFYFSGEEILDLKKEKQAIPPILITENVYDRLSLSIKDYFKEQKNIDVKDNLKKVYGANLKWKQK